MSEISQLNVDNTVYDIRDRKAGWIQLKTVLGPGYSSDLTMTITKADLDAVVTTNRMYNPYKILIEFNEGAAAMKTCELCLEVTNSGVMTLNCLLPPSFNCTLSSDKKTLTVNRNCWSINAFCSKVSQNE